MNLFTKKITQTILITKYAIILLSTILLISATWSCSIIKKNKEISREKIETLEVVKSDIQTETKKDDFSLVETSKISELTNILSDINWQYAGKDSAEIEITKTKSGIKIKTKGSGTADLKVKSETKTEKKDSTSQIKSHSYNSFEESIDKSVLKKTDKSKIDKSKEVKRFDLSVWWWIIMLILAILSLTYYWFFGRPKK